MPVVINEIVIRATIDELDNGKAGTSEKPDQESIIRECVEQVIEILKDKAEK